MHDNGAAACSAESEFVGLGPTCSVKIPFLQRPPDNVRVVLILLFLAFLKFTPNSALTDMPSNALAPRMV